MATQTVPIVRTSERLWSEEVGIAEATDPKPPYEPAYEFSNGRRFIEKSPFYTRLPVDE
jgi:hypothetical protein